jgi:tetratricopeptide (TPR) repeat protein
MPYLITNISQRTSIQYVESAIRLDPAKTFGAFSVLKEMAEKERDARRFDSLKAVYERDYPVSRYNQVMEKLDGNNLEAAMRLFASIPANRFDGDWQRIRSRYYYLRGEFSKALEHIDYAISLRPQEAEYYWQRGMIYFSMGKFESSLIEMRQAYGRDPKSPRILDALAYMFSQAGQADSTIYYGEKLVGLDSTALGGYYLLAKAYGRLSLADKAAFHARRFLQLTADDTAYGEQRLEMESLAGQSTPGVNSR